MKKIKLILLIILSIAKLTGLSNVFETKLKVFNHDEIKFYIGNIPSFKNNEPNFLLIPPTAWKDLDQYRHNNIESNTKIWFKIDLSGMIIPFNAIYFHSLKNNLKVYYPMQIYPTKETQKSINNYDMNSLNNKQIINLNTSNNIKEFQLNSIFFSIDIDQRTPLFKFFPVLVGDENNLKEYIINEEIIKRNTDYLTFFMGNFLFFVSFITFIIFLITLKNLNFTTLYFSFLMASAGLFYWMVSPLSLFFSDFSYSRMIYILTFYHLTWFFFGLLFASFLKKKCLMFLSLLVLVNLITTFLFPALMYFNRYFILVLITIFNIIIIFWFKKTKLDFLNTNSLFSIAAFLNIVFLVIQLFLPRIRAIAVFGPVGLGLFAWILAFTVYTYKKYNMTINELQFQKIQNLELTESNLESQLSSLKKQLDPHFIFNSLGTLIALIEIDKEAAIDFVQEFSKVYRYILDTQDNNFVRVEEELNFCHTFIFLLKKRFNDSIITNFSISAADLAKFVPPLSIQMLLENAIKHNIATEESPLEINIYTQDNFVVVENYLQLKKHNQPTSKLGLKNLNQRLYLLKKINIVIVESNNKFIAKIPLISEV